MKRTWKYAATFSLLCALTFAGCHSESEKFNPPESSYKAAFYMYSDGNTTLRVKGAAVTADFVKAARTQPLLGRFFTKDEFGGDGRVAIIKKTFWANHLGSNPSVIGKNFTLDGIQYTLIGVMPDSDSFNIPEGAQIWIPEQKPS
ncbi:MAG TPA: ABC transporter permease [Blastocatellia bacterium]|nr:ABC transporter permease [Blastocatellia bacterium]